MYNMLMLHICHSQQLRRRVDGFDYKSPLHHKSTLCGVSESFTPLTLGLVFWKAICVYVFNYWLNFH